MKFSEAAPSWARRANDPTPDEAWQDLVADITAAAQRHFVVNTGGSSERKAISVRRRDLLRRRWQLRSSGEEWTENFQSAILQTTIALRRAAREKYKEATSQRVDQLVQAREAGDFASIHRLARIIAGTGIGIRRRDYRLPPVHQPTQSE